MILSPAERKKMIESYGGAHAVLLDALTHFPKEMWTFKPRDGWSIHQLVIHITDSEANSYVRCRRLVAESGSPVLGYDEAHWAVALDYEGQSTEDALELFKLLRRISYNLVRRQPDSIGTHTILHSENGPMTFDDWLDTYDRHVPEHIAQMQRVFDEWQAGQPSH